ncbi:oleosin-B6-like [Cricetulus griseus]|uniref:oleosin-B6-like n=1 Tax=Cricetulus griseus TaxID=10029 RepID=UPI0015C3AD30|nr:oleosin-B6-like [Cricetulus griseus]
MSFSAAEGGRESERGARPSCSSPPLAAARPRRAALQAREPGSPRKQEAARPAEPEGPTPAPAPREDCAGPSPARSPGPRGLGCLPSRFVPRF